MIKSTLAVFLALAGIVACSQPPSQSAPAGQAAAPAPAAGQAQPADTKPAAEPAAAAPAAGSAAPPAAAPPPASASPASAPPAAAAAPAARAPEPPPPPPAPVFREVTIPAGTSLSVKLLNTLASDKSKVEDPIKGSIAKAVTVSGRTALPAGTQLLGTVTEAEASGRVKGRAVVAFRFDRLVHDGETMRVQTAAVRTEAEKDTKSDVKKGGLGAGVGAIVGGVIGGGKGAAIGAVAGGTGTVLATKGGEVSIPSGTIVEVLLQDAITLRVEVK